MTNERLKEIINHILDWGRVNDNEFRECLLYVMDLTEEEKKEFQLEDYISEENEDEDEEE